MLFKCFHDFKQESVVKYCSIRVPKGLKKTGSLKIEAKSQGKLTFFGEVREKSEIFRVKANEKWSFY